MSGILASTETNSFTPPELFVGGADVVTNSHLFATGLALAANSVVAFNAADELVEWSPGAVDGTTGDPLPQSFARFITCEAVDTSAGAAKNPVYEGGYFNTAAINWPGTATAVQKQKAFLGTNIHHRSLGYSG